jgi:hypothetical protein
MGYVYIDYWLGSSNCSILYENIKKNDLPPSCPEKLFEIIDESLYYECDVNRKNYPTPRSLPTPPIALSMIENLIEKSTGPKFTKLPDKKQV